MAASGVRMVTVATLVTILSASASHGAMGMGREIHGHAWRHGGDLRRNRNCQEVGFGIVNSCASELESFIWDSFEDGFEILTPAFELESIHPEEDLKTTFWRRQRPSDKSQVQYEIQFNQGK
ncbi:hypothetical protein AMTR_s00068p00201940 [Amborella trichopoda]|uniref:Uncharacterized protein n=1 Tax=Amborella trichopoda TaxID=13333 RepID=U5DEB6_AMBTC|nr:hypothetical protein AMTR_s00068p00201940 [Amborella trichopoda]